MNTTQQTDTPAQSRPDILERISEAEVVEWLQAQGRLQGADRIAASATPNHHYFAAEIGGGIGTGPTIAAAIAECPTPESVAAEKREQAARLLREAEELEAQA